MIDLHLHLDGSMTAGDIRLLAQEQRISLPLEHGKTLEQAIAVSESCENLNAYLRAFQIPLLVLQRADAIAYAVSSLLERLAEQGIRYAEIRFAPQLHCEKGNSQEQVVAAAIAGLHSGLKKGKGKIHAQLILCMMRGSENQSQNLETLRVAEKQLGNGVCAVDLAGAEARYPTRNFAAVFRIAKTRQIPFTMHAGEADGPQSVWDALSFGPRRIGHGVRSVEDAALLGTLAERKITLELCPTSNVQTKAVSSYAVHPVRALLHWGIHATVNTDNMTVSGTTISQEYACLRQYTGLTPEEHTILLCNAAEAAFLPEDKKNQLKAEIRQKQ